MATSQTTISRQRFLYAVADYMENPKRVRLTSSPS